MFKVVFDNNRYAGTSWEIEGFNTYEEARIASEDTYNYNYYSNEYYEGLFEDFESDEEYFEDYDMWLDDIEWSVEEY